MRNKKATTEFTGKDTSTITKDVVMSKPLAISLFITFTLGLIITNLGLYFDPYNKEPGIANCGQPMPTEWYTYVELLGMIMSVGSFLLILLFVSVINDQDRAQKSPAG